MWIILEKYYIWNKAIGAFQICSKLKKTRGSLGTSLAIRSGRKKLAHLYGSLLVVRVDIPCHLWVNLAQEHQADMSELVSEYI